MSPSEDSLRRALRDGEGDDLDPGFVVMRAESYRRARRARISGMVAAATVVACVGVGGGFLVANDNDSAHSGAGGGSLRSENDAAGGAAAGSTNGPANYGAFSSASALAGNSKATAATSCPDAIPRVPLPVTKGQTFYSAPVATAVVCAYTAPDGGLSRSVVLTGSDAQQLATSLEKTFTAAVPCPSTDAKPVDLVIEAWYMSGDAPLPVVVSASSECSTTATNGAVTRYRWSPPAGVAKLIAQLRIADMQSTLPATKPTS